MTVNPHLPEPESPHGWVTSVRCYGCGGVYQDEHFSVTFHSGVQLIRSQALVQGDEGAGYRSRSPVLWAMHILKLYAWYYEHAHCGPETENE